MSWYLETTPDDFRNVLVARSKMQRNMKFPMTTSTKIFPDLQIADEKLMAKSHSSSVLLKSSNLSKIAKVSS